MPERLTGALRRAAPGLGIALVTSLGAALFWKFRVLGPVTSPVVEFRNLDLFIEHVPMAAHGFRSLREGMLPLWNPFQGVGLPFFAIPHVGLLYPGNLAYWFVDPARATELTGALHLAFGGMCSWALVRALGLGSAAGAAAAATLMASGYWMSSVNQAAIYSALAWLPASALAVEATLRGRPALGGLKLGGPLLALAVASQLLNGATEFVVINAWGTGLYALARAAALRAGAGAGADAAARRRVAQRFAFAVGAALLGAGLAAVQLVPSLELAASSARATQRLAIDDARFMGVLAPGDFVLDALAVRGKPAAGLLPLAALVLGPGASGLRWLWWFGVLLAVAAANLSFGGVLYELYFATPLGGLFRIPFKFLHLYAFASALLAGFAAARLYRLAGAAERSTRRACLPAAAAFCLAALALGLAADSPPSGAVAALLAGAVALAATWGLGSPRARSAAVGVLLLLHGALLVASAGNELSRPSLQPGRVQTHAALLDDLGVRAGSQRVHLSRGLMGRPGLAPKQGTLRRLRVAIDYEPLVSAESQRFFEHAAGGAPDYPVYAGYFRLGEATRWRLLDLSATRIYVLRAGEPADRILGDQVLRGEARLVADMPGARVRIYERRDAGPRAFVVHAARSFADPERVLAELSAADFDASREVLLGAAGAESDAGGPAASSRAEFVVDDPQHVEIAVDARAPGWLVLADAYAPGWTARIDGRHAEILRANFLFRAVRIPAGRSLVSFDYAPASLERGAWISVFSLLGLGAFAAFQRSLEARTPTA